MIADRVVDAPIVCEVQGGVLDGQFILDVHSPPDVTMASVHNICSQMMHSTHPQLLSPIETLFSKELFRMSRA